MEQTLSFGEVVSVWITFVLSQGDHRLSQLQPWAEQNRLTLQALLAKDIRPRVDSRKESRRDRLILL